MTIKYGGARGAPVRIAPLDPHAVLPISLDIHDWLRGEVLTGQTWAAPADLVIGDGVATKTIGTGGVKTPPAPATFVDNGRTHVRAYVWLDDAVTDHALGTDYEIPVSLETATRGDDRTVVTQLRER